MKNAIHTLKLLAAVLAAGLVACQDAAVEVYDASLNSLLRPSAVTAVAADSEHIAVSWRGSAGAFRLEYALNEDFAGDVAVVEPVEDNKYTVGELTEATTYYFRVMALSDKTGVSSSEYSAVATARTLTEPKIPNVKASSEMAYTTSPWSVTCTVTMTWGEAGTEPEAISEVRATPAAGGQALVFPVSEEEAAAQRTAFSEGVLTDTEYTLELYAGKKMRGTCTHRTVPGPVPALYASAQLDFTTDPVSASAEIRWELYYVSPEELSEIALTRKGSELPERQVPVTLADIAAGSATVTALAPGAEYTAALNAKDGKQIAATTFTTPEAPGQDVIVVRPGDDLAAIISAPDRQYETVYLVAGEYTVTADAAIPIARNLELYSDDPARTTISITKNFQPEGTLEQIILRNLRIECSTYLMQARSDYDIALLRIDNCIVDLNSGATGASTLFNTTKGTATKQILHQYEVVNSIVFSNAGQTQNIVYGSASGSIGEFEKIVMRHSTFSNCARGLIYVTNTADCAYEIELENCTLYNVASAGSNALIDIRMAGTANASGRRIALRNSVMWFGSTKGYQVLRFAGSGEGQYVPKEQIDCANFYHFASQTPAFGSSAYNVADRMTPYGGTPAELWQNPMADPSAAGASFRIKDQSVRAAQEAAGTTLGDPRWE